MLAQHHHKLKLGIDAKWFFAGPPSGHMVVKNLVSEIIEHNNGRLDLYLFITRKFKQQARDHFPAGVKLIFLPGMPNLLSNLLLMPLMALRYGIKAILFQNFSSIWPGRLFKIGYIHDVLFLDYPQYYSKTELLYFKQMKWLAAFADKIITISNTEKSRLIKNRIADACDIDVVYHGINKKFKPLSVYPQATIQALANKYGLPPKYLLYVGRVNIRKNLITLVKAMDLLKQHNVKLVIAGGDIIGHAGLDQYINVNNLGGNIIFTGHVPEEDLYVIYAGATVFCFPSYAEGFGLPPLEAMQCGVPVVVSNRTAMPEICGGAALYINPDDEKDIACKINTLLTDSDMYNEKVLQGIAHAHKFSWAAAANSILILTINAYADRECN